MAQHCDTVGKSAFYYLSRFSGISCKSVFYIGKSVCSNYTSQFSSIMQARDKKFTLNSCGTTVILRHLELIPHLLKLQFHLLFP